MSSATRTIISQRENLNYLIVCFTWCALFFQCVCFLLPCIICENVCNEIDAFCDASRQVIAD